MPVNRREFLRGSGGALFFGAAFASVPLAAIASPDAATSAPETAAVPDTGVERWLLETGKREIDSDVYHLVARQAR
ncbi:MAG TPA: hypothetical protein VHU81_13765 [Thermoanaerobaculia bacterium]|jgi:hypothetical protein|nr:hypothetical protein [Thermoanaerobaculia bacterium]